jgi:flagella basal body P-ring formation protein FlgA
MTTNIGDKVNIVRIFTYTLLLSISATTTAEMHTEAELLTLTDRADMFISERLQSVAADTFRTEYQIGNIDPRLQQNSCETAINFELKRPPLEAERNTLSISCASPTWQIYVNVAIKIYGKKIVAKHAIPRNTVIQAKHLKLQEQQINKNQYAAYTKHEQVVGLTLTRSIRAGADFRPSYLRPADLVARGDEVVIIARSSTISIQMKGEALSNGVYGEQIRVKNKSSDRIIVAQVIDSGTVSILM